MGNNNYSPFFAAYNTAVKRGCSFTKEELVEQFTNGRTCSLRQLSPGELRELVLTLNRLTDNKKLDNGDNEDNMNHLRKKIISMMIEMWAVDEKGKADMHFIYWFSINYIHNKKLNELNLKELHSMISIIQTKWLPWYYKQKKTNIDFSIKNLAIK